jgi:REP element-mobilizing transposase RayT
MPRPPRLQFPGAIYHIVTRGDGRRAIFHDDGHYARFTDGLADEVQR